MVVAHIFNNFKSEFEKQFNKKITLLYENGCHYEIKFSGRYGIEVQSLAKHYNFEVTKVIQHNTPCQIRLTYKIVGEEKEPLERFQESDDLSSAALRLLAYSFNDIKNYDELTNLEKLAITKVEFKELRCIIEELGYDQNIDRLKHKKR